jgi:hypothetical protein
MSHALPIQNRKGFSSLHLKLWEKERVRKREEEKKEMEE